MDSQTTGRLMPKTIARSLVLLMLWLGGVAHAGTVTYVYTDPQGTPLAEADANGNITATFDYAPYGSQALGTAPSGPGYTGHVNDPDTGLVYMQARYYDPVVGRFISTDPVGPAAGNPFNFNRFAYANNSPAVNIDPDGRCTGSLFCDGSGAGVPGVVGAGYTMFINASPSEGGGRTTSGSQGQNASLAPSAHNIDKNKIVDYLDEHAQKRSIGQCAAYCRRACEAGGMDTVGHPVGAKDYGPLLLRNGATLVSPHSFVPIKGNVAVFAGSDVHPYGHIAVFDGSQWVSDFKQKNMSPYRSDTPPVTIYRFPETGH